MQSSLTPQYMRLLPMDVLSRFARVNILTRNLVQGFKSGPHRSPFLGASTEFAEHREYSPGDDPRDFDWRVFGRTDRYCIKQYVQETNVRATILLDSSASMRFCGSASELSKFEYACHLAASMAYLCLRQGDAVGLIRFDSQLRSVIPAASKASTLRILLQALHEAKPQNESRVPEALHEIATRIPRRGLVIVISDLLDDASDIVKSLYGLRHQKHDLIVFQVLSDEELTFPFDTSTQFRDLEDVAADIDVDPRAIRRDYLQRFQAHLEALDRGCGELHADYVLYNTRTPYADALSRYLASRMRR